MKQVIAQLFQALQTQQERPAFCIEHTYYSYRQLAETTAAIRRELRHRTEKNVGLVANDDLQTYASILALWMEGKCYIPLHPGQPLERCLDIIGQMDMTLVLDSSTETRYQHVDVIMTARLDCTDGTMEQPATYADNELAYILFTSGSTGRPKGVPLTRGNLQAFVDAFFAMGITLTAEDKGMQMFDLTFDLSVMSYLLPLLVGGCVYTVSYKHVKYMAAFELLDTYPITFFMMVPSVIHYLRPYVDELNLPHLRYALFAGEALMDDDLAAWAACVPNARIMNTYGPTEDTIICTYYDYHPGQNNKTVNGIVSIGRAMQGVDTFIADETGHPVAVGEKGELCLAGAQLTPGYWRNEEKNREAFFMKDSKRYYRTGDICTMDEDGDIMYYGRKDSQIKIQGFRIELSEIECVARDYFDNSTAVVALPMGDERGINRIELVVESADATSATELMARLKKKLPSYMVPAKIHHRSKFPLNANNKIDRKKLKEEI
uniref:Amino acid adenylation domain-containing protein n=1 Tax=Prevotella sp. GTC17259 TaxID=3236795 RepID=A0AB33J1T4_9BACT